MPKPAPPLPFVYFVDPRLRAVLFPTLLCACLHDTVNLRILSSRLAPAHLLTPRAVTAPSSPASSLASSSPESS